jgi:hypothetical protein
MNRALKRAGAAVGGGAAAAALAWGGYALTTWARYSGPERGLRSDPLLDRFLPNYEVRERHETLVSAPAEVAWAAARELDLNRSPVVRAIFKGRGLLMRSGSGGPPPARGFFDEVLALGWQVLAEEPGREIVMGAVTRPWEANVLFRGLPPDAFLAFDEPGYAQIAWTFAVEPLAPERARFSTETRVRTTDPISRERFRRYWSVFSPGVLLIRYESLRLIRQDVRRRMAVRLGR